MKYKIIFLLSVTLLIGCQESDSDNGSSKKKARLVGSYTSDCYYSPLLSSYVIENLEYDIDTFDNVINQYSNSDCSSGIVDSLNTYGTITYYGKVMTTDGTKARRADFDIDTGGVATSFEGVTKTVYRKTDVELYFGAYKDGETPTVSYSLTFYKN